MKKAIIAVSLLTTMYSCTPGGGTTTPATPSNTFDITVNGHSYHLSGNISSNPPVSITATTMNVGSYYLAQIEGGDLTKTVAFSGQFYKKDLSTATGIYYCGYDSTAAGKSWPGGFDQMTPMTLVDYADGSKTYNNNFGIFGNQTSTVDITVSNGTQVKGTFSLKLHYNGTVYPITGSFDYRH